MAVFHYQSFWSNSFDYRRFPKYLGYLFRLLTIISGFDSGGVKLKNGLVFKIGNLTDLVVLKEVFYDKCYEQKVQILTQDKVIVDVGAGFGDFAISTARRFPKSTLYAFEPDKKYFSLLVQNISLNNIKNVVPLNQSVLGKEKLFEKQIDFLKIDCEGCEFEIIKNLNLNRIKKIALEFHESNNHSVASIISKLKTIGFRLEYQRKDIKGLGMLWAKRV